MKDELKLNGPIYNLDKDIKAKASYGMVYVITKAMDRLKERSLFKSEWDAKTMIMEDLQKLTEDDYKKSTRHRNWKTIVVGIDHYIFIKQRLVNDLFEDEKDYVYEDEKFYSKFYIPPDETRNSEGEKKGYIIVQSYKEQKRMI